MCAGGSLESGAGRSLEAGRVMLTWAQEKGQVELPPEADCSRKTLKFHSETVYRYTAIGLPVRPADSFKFRERKVRHSAFDVPQSMDCRSWLSYSLSYIWHLHR